MILCKVHTRFSGGSYFAIKASASVFVQGMLQRIDRPTRRGVMSGYLI